MRQAVAHPSKPISPPTSHPTSPSRRRCGRGQAGAPEHGAPSRPGVRDVEPRSLPPDDSAGAHGGAPSPGRTADGRSRADQREANRVLERPRDVVGDEPLPRRSGNGATARGPTSKRRLPRRRAAPQWPSLEGAREPVAIAPLTGGVTRWRGASRDPARSAFAIERHALQRPIRASSDCAAPRGSVRVPTLPDGLSEPTRRAPPAAPGARTPPADMTLSAVLVGSGTSEPSRPRTTPRARAFIDPRTSPGHREAQATRVLRTEPPWERGRDRPFP